VIATGPGNRIEANNVKGSQAFAGFRVPGSGNLLIRNSATGNVPVNYDVAIGSVMDGNYEY
jgi:hypothetical protein